MRNLVDVYRVHELLRLPADFGNIRYIVVDEDGLCVYVANEASMVACAWISTGEVRCVWDILDLAAQGGTPLDLEAMMSSMTWAAELDALVLGYTSGDVFVLNVACIYNGMDSDMVTLEGVGTVEGGVAVAAWSPDGELLAVVTGLGQLVLMTPEWDVVWEGNLSNNEPVFPQPTAPPDTDCIAPPSEVPYLHSSNCSISWRGDGKYFATCTEDMYSDCDEHERKLRPPRIRIWDRETHELHALGESEQGLLPVISWQPNNRHLFVANHTSPDDKRSKMSSDALEENNWDPKARGPQGQAPEVRHVGAWKRELRRRQEAAIATGEGTSCNKVTLYERNGLRHGSFDIPRIEDHMKIESLNWSPDSELLAVILSPNSDHLSSDKRTQSIRILQLWHRSNWHWYLKYEQQYNDTRGLSCCWLLANSSSTQMTSDKFQREDVDSRFTLVSVTAEGKYSLLKFIWDVSVSMKGTSIVIDGTKALITPLRQCIMPPPLSAATVSTDNPIITAAIRNARDHGDKEALALVQSNGKVAIVESINEDFWEETLNSQLEISPWQGSGSPLLLPVALVNLQKYLKDDVGFDTLRHASWLKQSRLVVTACIKGSDLLMEFDLGDYASNWQISNDKDSPSRHDISSELIVSITCPERIIRLVPSCHDSSVVIETLGGNLWKYSSGGQLVQMSEHFPVNCTSISTLPLSNISVQDVDRFAANNLVYDRFSKSDSNLGRELVVGLSSNGKLYLNQYHIADYITSFSVRFEGPGGPFLFYTTKYHTLRTVALQLVIKTWLSFARVSDSGLDNFSLKRLCDPSGTERGRMETKTNVKEDDICLRDIEEGAWLIAIPAGSEDVVCQAPRGNLEVVRPRALVLPAVADALDKNDFSSAWFLATINRLDLNILIDYKWPRSLSYAKNLLEAIGSDIDAADFLCGLKSENVCEGNGAYASILSDRALDGFESGNILSKNVSISMNPVKEEDKISTFCSALRQSIADIDQGTENSTRSIRKWLRTKVISFSITGALSSALLLIKRVKEAEMSQSSSEENVVEPSDGISCTAEQALKYLLINAGEETVYRAALSCYELELAYMIVTHSQRDPGEVLIELQEFAAIKSMRLRHAAIDEHIGNYSSSVHNYLWSAIEQTSGNSENSIKEDSNHIEDKIDKTSKVQAESETKLHPHFIKALEISKQHNLLRLLLSFLSHSTSSKADNANESSNNDCFEALVAACPEKYIESMKSRVYFAIGEDLESRNRHEDAALAFVAAGEGERALRGYRLAGEWRAAMTIALQLGRDNSSLKAMAIRMVADLEDSHRHLDAAELALEYLGDVQEGVRLLCAAGEWRRAMYTATYHKQHGCLEKIIIPTAVSSAERILRNIEDDKERVLKYRARLEDVRARREAMESAVAARALETDGHVTSPDMDDLASEAPSVVSGLSAYTAATGMTGMSMTSGSSFAASTIGGKGKVKKKGKKGSKKIRQGSPEEEMELARLLLALTPLPAVCNEVGQLSELLCMLSNADDAAKLQRALKEMIDLQQNAITLVLKHPPPGMGLQIAEEMMQQAYYSGGAAAISALEKVASTIPGEKLNHSIVESESSLRSSKWKWEVLRDP